MVIKGFRIAKLFLISSLLFAFSVTESFAESFHRNPRYAAQERANAAVAHYARARAMLVRALQEFERGRTLAQPELLLNSEEWRLSVIARAEDLNKVLDPQPRVTRSGVRFEANGLMVKRERFQLPDLEEGPYPNNYHGVALREKEIRFTRAKLKEASSKDLTQEQNTQILPEIQPETGPAVRAVQTLKKEEAAIIEQPQVPVANSQPLAEESVFSVEDIIPEEPAVEGVENYQHDPRAQLGVMEDGVSREVVANNTEVNIEQTPELLTQEQELVVENSEEVIDEEEAIAAAIENSIRLRLEKLSDE